MSADVLLLAAGRSSRFDGIKQLADLNGKLLINHVIDNLKQIKAKNIYVALGANADKILPVLTTKTTPFICNNWHLGMGHSLADAIVKIKNNNDVQGLLIALVDQALIPHSHYQQLQETHLKHPKKIIATKANKKIMPPVIFPKEFFNSLTELTGDKGANNIIKNNINEVILVECHNAIHDIDTFEDYTNTLLEFNRNKEQV